MLSGDAAAAESNTDESSEPSRVIAFHSAQRWQLHFNSSKQLNKLVSLFTLSSTSGLRTFNAVEIVAMVVDFSATWCGPCKFMEPVFNNLAAKYTDVDFVKIDVDELSDISREFGVQAMPTFLMLKQGKEVERVIGAKKDELEQKIRKHREAPKFAA
ncbi:UNVERIFIED_CONTAM: Thioredoxin H2 [Sesamum calycinum]|uniref:Thioredoxin H2 n=1 Tax=Sesamum calycinum TaxID=2727403 RepID=A0AAW2SSV1_9LAMI